ncbi:TenA family transcriptional regulator [Sphingopyxis terrae]|uniref:Pyrroloquinoline quinone (PQQ) biosynthesis protein C n=1 Tax=Sphingopyxis terrae subsp. ummariensis TaxID=429001 RepID=A0A1Y6FTM8_9SPHN|nr:iron-containing redox enzyme family protein [Sphingopyxis terrae]SMQ76851.1 Pyrroloquinoline quinone (PQQ) biosynthesis protein C [Sphingopyxis terrae subsp. ummariensis]
MSVFINDLVEESLNHRAVHHPYLRALSDGDLPDTQWALADFADHYYGYSLHFPRYLTTVISKLEIPAHRGSLLENLTEESGVYGEEEYAELAAVGVEREWIEGVPHPQLFRRFREATGITSPYSPDDEAIELVCWRESFLGTLTYGSAAEALGALGLGTENIVSTIYVPFVKALSRTDLNPRDTVFFPLHTAVDDHHQEALEEISLHFAATPTGKGDLRRGMIKALSLRSSFWDWMYERALTCAGASRMELVS